MKIIISLFTSTGSLSLLLAVLLGVLVLRGVFDETGVFGLNKMHKLDYTMNVTSVDKKMIYTYADFII